MLFCVAEEDANVGGQLWSASVAPVPADRACPPSNAVESNEGLYKV